VKEERRGMGKRDGQERKAQYKKIQKLYVNRMGNDRTTPRQLAKPVTMKPNSVFRVSIMVCVEVGIQLLLNK